jgi:hypothetical protein
VTTRQQALISSTGNNLLVTYATISYNFEIQIIIEDCNQLNDKFDGFERALFDFFFNFINQLDNLKLNNIPCILNHHLKISQVIQFDTFFNITNNQSIDELNDSLNDLNEKLLNETTKAQLEQEFIDKVNETINISLKVNLSALSDKIEILIDALSGDPCQLVSCPQYYNPACYINNFTCEHFCENGYCKNKAQCFILADKKPSCK